MRRIATLAAALLAPVTALAQVERPLGPDFRVSLPGAGYVDRAAVSAAPDGRFVVAWATNSPWEIWVRRHAASGAALGAPLQASGAGPETGDEVPTVAIDPGGGFVVAWRRFQDGAYAIFARRFAASGAPLSAEIRLDSGTEAGASGVDAPAAACGANGNCLVAWARWTSAGVQDVVVRVLGPSGAPLSAEAVADAPGEAAQAPDVAFDPASGTFLVAWRGADVNGRRFSTSGAAAGPVLDLNPSGRVPAVGPAIAVNGSGRLVVAFEESFGAGPIVAQTFDAAGVPQTPPVAVTGILGIGGLGDVAIDRTGAFVVVWSAGDGGGCGTVGCDTDEGIFGAGFTPAGTPFTRGDTADSHFAVNADRLGVQFHPAIAMDARGRFVVAWDFFTNEREETGPETAIVARRFDTFFPDAAPVDFGGNGDTDVAVFRPSQGRWAADFDFQPSVEMNLVYGTNGDVPVPKDYDGDGVTDLAVFRPSTANWFVDTNRNGGSDFRVTYGRSSDVPVPGDYDGDGRADLAVYRPASGTWFVDLNRNGGTDLQRVLGGAGQIPVPGDYDGDGRTDVAVFGAGRWRIDLGANGSVDVDLIYGRAGDVPIPGDWDANGTTDLAVFRPESANWFVDLNRNGGSDLRVAYGFGSDVPVPGDFDGDGAWDLAVYRPSSGRWFVDVTRNGGTDLAVTFGAAGDRPLRENGWILDVLGVTP